MSRATDYLEQLGSDRRVVEPSVVDAIIGLGMVFDERLGQTRDVLIRIQMTLEELLAEAKHARAAIAPREPDADPDPLDVGPLGSGLVMIVDDQAEPDVDDEPPARVIARLGRIVEQTIDEAVEDHERRRHVEYD